MPKTSSYTPPKVWRNINKNGGKWANINRPTAGATHEKELPVGKHPLQLYSLATPNGVKVTILLEELLALEELPLPHPEQQSICLLYTSPSPRDS